MTSSQHERLEQLFSAALTLGTESERATFLEEQCGDNLALISNVNELLEAHSRVGSFLDTPRVALDETREFCTRDEVAGTKIGRYKILSRVGEGGFGSVFMAEQEEPVRRTVALKIIKLGMDTKEVIARFEAERQALALMDHPNIARVYDAGATDTGRPYFVMELVDGVAIHKYCDDHRLTTQQRLELFLPVCQAVQHAHQKGIIHRDLKPTNVLVMLREGKPIPKVIDFGIAKATSQRLTEKTLYTGFREFVGTPEYMSPDQAGLSGEDIDTRTDIYSLGVLLYEMLTSGRPLDRDMRDCTSLAEILRIIREVEPPKPSARWLVSNNSSDLEELARRRHSEPKALARRIRGDLDWIVMKALEKNRSRRYATAKDLADDVERHLEHLPITASAPGMTYRCRKFVRRHRVAVLAGSVVAIALIMGFALATVGLFQANRARVALKNESDAAKRAHASATATNKFLQQMLASVDPDKALGREVTVRYMLDEAAKKISEGALSDQPEVEAAVRMTLGETYEGLGAYETAESHLRAASDIFSSHCGERDAQTLRSQRALAGVLRIQGEFAAAESLLRRTAEMQTEILGDAHPDTLASRNQLALALWGPERFTEAESIHRDTLEIQQRVLGAEHPDTLDSMIHLGGVYRELGKLDQAETQLREALTLCRRVHGEDHPQTSKATNSLGLLLEDQRSYPQAEELFRRTYEVDRHILGSDHPQTLVSMNHLLRVLNAQGKVDERQPYLRDRLAHLERAAARPDASAFDLYAYAWELLNSEAFDLRDHELALQLMLRAVKMDAAKDANLLESLALAHYRNGNLDHAIATQRQALEQARLGGPYNRADVEAKLTSYLVEKGDLLGATAVSWKNLASRLGRTLLSGETPSIQLIAQSDALMAEGRFEEAAGVLRGCMAILQKDLPEGHWMIADTQSQLGAAVAADGKLSEAEPILLEAYAGLKDNREAPRKQKRLALERIVRLYQRWNKPEQVSKWRQLLDEQDRQQNPSVRRESRDSVGMADRRPAGSLEGLWSAYVRGRETRAQQGHPRLNEYRRLLSDAIRRPQLGTPNHEPLDEVTVAPLVENEERRC